MMFTDSMRHVKAEHMHPHDKDLDDDDDLDLEDDHRRVAEHPYHHSMHHHHHPHYAPDDHLKDDGVIKSDCVAGVPIPATKPKIWSLADTAACKTPPPPHQYQMHLHQVPHQQQHYVQQQQQHQQQQQLLHHQQQQQQQHHMGGSQQHHHSQQQPWGSLVDPVGAGGSAGNFALPTSASMSPSSAATAPYSGARYGGFLSSSSGGQLQHYNPNSSSGSSSSASSSAAAGFPEVGTDTPPQTPPNMKVATPNGVIQGPPTGYCPGGSSSTPSGNSAATAQNPGGPGYAYGIQQQPQQQGNAVVVASAAANYGTRLQNSPHKDFAAVSQNSVVLHQHQTTASLPPTEAATAFKPFYKG